MSDRSEPLDAVARWRRVKRIFQEALDRDAGARDAFLAAECRDDVTLRTEVQALLLADGESSGAAGTVAIESGIDHVIGGIAEDRPYPPGTRFGPYRILAEIGRGGMGVVYRAERADDYRKEVAIKVVRRGLRAGASLDRFRYERQTLAGLDHPNIARILDGGTTDDGCPYFVMDYVEGLPIDDYCDRHDLSIGDRLRLFLEVTAAVGFAHRNLVVHRDLKPDNILVSAEGVPKLVDFGIATVLEKGSLETTTRPDLEIAKLLMTPEYASPEQIKGRPITTATDVYSLGIVLYVLLSGHRPYDVAGVEPSRLEQLICETVPDPPSAASTPPLGQLLSGDLDAIVLRAIQKQPDLRYPSAEQLADDIRRHLDNLPVAARPDSVPYRTAKFMRRHRIGVVACAAAAVTGVLGVAAIVRQARIASWQRARAERRLIDVRRLASSFMFDIHDAIVDIPGTTAARTLMVRRALEYLDGLTGEAGGDPSLQRDLADAYLKVGDAQGRPTSANIGDTAGAKASYEKAIDIARALVTANRGDLEAQRTLAMAYRKQADVFAWAGDVAGGLERARTSVERFKEIGATAESGSDDQLQEAIAEIKLGDLLGNENFPNAGQREEAVQAYQASLPILTQMAQIRPADDKVQRYLGIVHERLGQMGESRGDLSGALEEYQASFDIRGSLAAEHRYHTDIQRDFAVAHEKIANVLSARGDIAGALARYRSSLAMFEALAADRSNAGAARSVAISCERIGDTLKRTPDVNEALKMYRRALRIHEELSARDPANTQARHDLARLVKKLAE
jgi:tetratricopeptide (TPR) repeat protein